jgi:hypothetical protein
LRRQTSTFWVWVCPSGGLDIHLGIRCVGVGVRVRACVCVCVWLCPTGGVGMCLGVAVVGVGMAPLAFMYRFGQNRIYATYTTIYRTKI